MRMRKEASRDRVGRESRRQRPTNRGTKRAGGSARSGPKGALRRSSRKTTPTVSVNPFEAMGGHDGCAAVIVVAERAGTASEHDRGTSQVIVAPGGTGRAANGGKGALRTAGRRGTIPAKTCRALAAVGHEQRLRLLGKLLEGPATYRSLQRVTKLKAGPLYHHVNQLRLAGLIMPKQRDLYELTRGGRNLVLVAMAMGSLIGDTRRRPQPSS